MFAEVVMSLAAQELAHLIGPRLIVRTLVWCLEPRENSNDLVMGIAQPGGTKQSLTLDQKRNQKAPPRQTLKWVQKKRIKGSHGALPNQRPSRQNTFISKCLSLLNLLKTP